MIRAIMLEISMWLNLHAILSKPPVADDAYPALCRKLRPYVGILIDLLLLEEEMMTSPLTQHYVQQIEALRALIDGATP